MYNKPLLFPSVHKIMWLDFYQIGIDKYKKVYEDHFKQSYEEDDQQDV